MTYVLFNMSRYKISVINERLCIENNDGTNSKYIEGSWNNDNLFHVKHSNLLNHGFSTHDIDIIQGAINKGSNIAID